MTGNSDNLKERLCCIFNYAPHYRESIFKMMDEEMDCDFYFGDYIRTNIKKMEIRDLRQSKELKTIWFSNKCYVISGSVMLMFKPYKKYLLTGHIYCFSNWIILLLAIMFRKEVYVWNHGWYGKESLLRTWINKIYYSSVKAFFLYGEYAKKLMIRNGYSEKKLHVVYNSLDYEQTRASRNELTKSDVFISRFKNFAPVLIYIGRLQQVKKLDMLITAVYRMKLKGRPVNLVLIGDGEENSALNDLTKRYSLTDNVWFYGPCYDEKVIGILLYNADLCISPGNAGLTAIHSLSYGTPVITHNDFTRQMPEFESITPGTTGSFYNAGSLDSLIREIETWLLDNPSKSIEVIQACFKTIDEKYNPAYQIRIFKDVLATK